MAEVALVCVNYKTPKHLARLVETLHADDNGVWNLRIANNGSRDNSVRVIQRLRERYRIADVALNANIGYARACNQLGALGDEPIIGFLNADVWLTSADVAKIKRTFDNYPQVAILGPKQRDENGRITGCPIVWHGDKLKHIGWAESDTQNVKYRELRKVATVSGSAYFIRRSVLDELTNCEIFQLFCKERGLGSPESGMLPTKHFFEETFLSMHATAHNYEIFYDGAISIGHTHAASTGKNAPILRQYFLESREIYRAACDAHGIRYEQ